MSSFSNHLMTFIMYTGKAYLLSVHRNTGIFRGIHRRCGLSQLLWISSWQIDHPPATPEVDQCNQVVNVPEPVSHTNRQLDFVIGSLNPWRWRSDASRSQRSHPYDAESFSGGQWIPDFYWTKRDGAISPEQAELHLQGDERLPGALP